MTHLDPIALAQDLIRCPSVTPADGGAISVVERALSEMGFTCHRLPFQAPRSERVENLYARLGSEGPNFCFAGHTDVVPVGNRAGWRHDPFGAGIENGVLYGRGASDMKSAVAAFVAASSRYLSANTPKGSISLLITGDEEGPGINGTSAVLRWLKERGEIIDHCLVGEPTSAARTGDIIKIGRRGTMRIAMTAKGIQGHTAYPQNALNPIPILANLVARLHATPLDNGTDHFEPTTLVFTTFDVGNPATNVSPGEASAACNIRFNDSHTSDELLAHVARMAKTVMDDMGGEITLDHNVSGEAFLTAPGAYTELLRAAVQKITGLEAQYSTGGGTSDARFIKDYCPVAELGLPGTTMHKTDECMPIAEIETLTKIYTEILTAYFAAPPA